MSHWAEGVAPLWLNSHYFRDSFRRMLVQIPFRPKYQNCNTSFTFFFFTNFFQMLYNLFFSFWCSVPWLVSKVLNHMQVFHTILTVFWRDIDIPRSFHLWLPGNDCSTLNGPNNKMLHSPRGGFFLPFIFPWRTGFCVTDDESPVYCCIAPIRLFSRVALHNTKSPTLCDIMPILWRAELSRGTRQLPPTKLSICQFTHNARFGRTTNHFVSF